ncbi:MAG: cation diffusion facilitator family transporter [Kordiimonadaceae bacterium]|nr:cation diffusion facilitator family transporter [Kordiimonadaceae bacterium]
MSDDKAANLMRRATRAAMMVASFLLVAKGYAWWKSGSIAMQGSFADSALDLAASLVTFMAVKTALEPADDSHRFGHGKAEALAGLFQAAIMSGSAVYLLLEAVSRLWQPVPVAASGLVISISALAIVLSLVLVMFQSYVVKQTGSLAIAGDHLHYKGDLLLNLGVIAAAYIGARGYLYADGVFGVLIAFYILWGAKGIVGPAIDMLMDREFSDDDRETIANLALGNAAVFGLHDLKTRASGRSSFIQMHLEVDGKITVQEGHAISDEVEATIGEQFPGAEILIHIDPPTALSADLTINELKKYED